MITFKTIHAPQTVSSNSEAASSRVDRFGKGFGPVKDQAIDGFRFLDLIRMRDGLCVAIGVADIDSHSLVVAATPRDPNGVYQLLAVSADQPDAQIVRQAKAIFLAKDAKLKN
jgi:hypothetical protein